MAHVRGIAAWPTEYGRTLFRSRLEARWAAFFDMAGWQWIYEPFDMIGWTPDFALVGHDADVLVEVKPIIWPARVAPSLMRRLSVEAGAGKAARMNREALVLGAAPVLDDHDVVLGYFLHEADGGHDVAVLHVGHGRALDFCARDGSYAYRIGGECDGKRHLHFVDFDDVRDLWNEAGTVTRWEAA